MKVFKTVTIVTLSLVALVASIFFSLSYFREKPGGILVDSTPSSSVYIDGKFVGSTPFSGSLPAGQKLIKIVPEVADQNLVAYETRVAVISGVETVVRREFASSEDESSGDVLYFGRISGRDAGVFISSIPNNTQVSIDGVVEGFTPYTLSNISPAQHRITVKAPGYVDRVMTVQTLGGYKLNVFAKLGRVHEAQTSTESGEMTSQVKTYVKILNTPTGYLRVRTLPGSGGEEIAEVKPGSVYPYLNKDVATGWYEIQYQDPAPGLPDGIVGWVSSQYTEISSQSALLQTPTP